MSRGRYLLVRTFTSHQELPVMSRNERRFTTACLPYPSLTAEVTTEVGWLQLWSQTKFNRKEHYGTQGRGRGIQPRERPRHHQRGTA